MFTPRYFSPRYWAARYWGPGFEEVIVIPVIPSMEGDRIGIGGTSGRVYDFVARNRTIVTDRKKFRSKFTVRRR